jgi:AcrR family transcriptional regulator
VLTAREDVTAFTIDAVAMRAGVARNTIYYQFGSKVRLVEAVFDSLPVRSGSTAAFAVHEQSDPVEGLRAFIRAFVEFYAADRLVIRRLSALAALDPTVEPVWHARTERRRALLQQLVPRIMQRSGRPSPARQRDAIDLVYSITSFEMYDAFSGEARRPSAVIAGVLRLAMASLDVNVSETPERPRRVARRVRRSFG